MMAENRAISDEERAARWAALFRRRQLSDGQVILRTDARGTQFVDPFDFYRLPDDATDTPAQS